MDCYHGEQPQKML